MSIKIFQIKIFLSSTLLLMVTFSFMKEFHGKKSIICRITRKEISFTPARRRRVGPCQGQHDPRSYARNARLRTSTRGARIHRGRRRRMDAATGPLGEPAAGRRLYPRCRKTDTRVCIVYCTLIRFLVFC